MAGPLSHIRVIELSRILAGPWAGQLLADLGAEVIKVERPGVGDDTRHWGPPYLQTEDGESTAEAAYYLCANRGKRSVTVDIATEAGQRIIRELAAKSDALIENYRVGGLAKYDLDYDSLSEVNSALVYCSLTGFGQTGPYRHRAGYDFLIQAMAGLMSVTGEPDESPGGGPQKVGVALSDVLTGLYATVGVLAALAEREKTGRGQHIDLALLDVQVACLANQASNYLVSGVAPSRLGNAHPNIVPYQAFATADGHIILAVGNDDQFRKFCDVAGCAGIAENAQYATNRARVENRNVLCAELSEIIGARTSHDWLESLEAVSVPCGPINSIDEVFADPQVQARNLRIEFPHPQAGQVPLVANPLNLSRTPVEYKGAPPLLGEHTESVLESVLGYTADDIEELRRPGSI